MTSSIRTVEAIPVAYPEPNDFDSTRHICLVRIETHDGVIGWGEAVTMWREAALATAAVVAGMAELLVGEDPLAVEHHWNRLREHAWWYGHGGGLASFAISAIDIALWDVRGKLLGQNVVQLLGGPAHPRLPAIAAGHAVHADMDELVEAVAGWARGGLHGVKVGFGKRGHANLGYEHDRDIAFVQRLRAALGPDALLMVDVGQANRWDVATALRRVRAMEEHGLTWIEEPLGPDDPLGYRALRAGTTTAIAVGEREWRVSGYERLLSAGYVDVIGVDPGRAEGITGFRRVCERVETARRQVNAHAWSAAIITAASLAVSLSSPAARLFEVKPMADPMQNELVRQPVRHVDGWVYPLTAPGLGIEIDEGVVARYRIDRPA